MKSREIVFTSTDEEAELQGYFPSGWKVVCVGSCRTKAFVGAWYRVSGPGMPSSKAFAVPGAPDPFTVRADTGSTGGQVVGMVMIAGGAVTAPVSMGLLVTATCSESCSGVDQARRDRADAAGKALLPVFIGGLVVAAVGVAMFISSGTSLDINAGKQARAPHLRLGRGLELTPTGLVF